MNNNYWFPLLPDDEDLVELPLDDDLVDPLLTFDLDDELLREELLFIDGELLLFERLGVE